MADKKEIKVLHKKSNQLSNGGPKLPTSGQLDYGEIAINYSKGSETISIKNDEDEIVTFQNEVFVGDKLPDENTTFEIFIDETMSDENIDIYTKADVDSKLQKLKEDADGKYLTEEDLSDVATKDDIEGVKNQVQISEGIQGEIMVDESLNSGDERVYTASEVDSLFKKLVQENPTLKWS